MPSARAGLHEWVVGFFTSLAHGATRHPRRTLLFVTLITLGAVPGMWSLQLRMDGRALVSPKAPEVIYDKSIREQFGIEDQIVVLVHSQHPEGIYNPATVQLVRDLTDQFSRMPGVGLSNIMSLATEPSFRFRPGTFALQTLLQPPLTTKAELDQLRDDLRKIELYTGTLVSTDGHSTAILIGTPSDGDRARLYHAVLDIIDTKQSPVDNIAVTGAPVAESLLGIHILEDLGVPKSLLGAARQYRGEKVDWALPTNFYQLRRLLSRRIGLVPAAALIMILIFFLSFRSALAAVLPLPGLLSMTLFVFGLMGWFGVPIYLTTAVIPVLLTAISVPDYIYVFNRYFTLLRETPGVPHVDLVRKVFDELVRPLVNTSLATGIAFVSFGFSPLRPVQAFGVFTGVGVLFSLFFSFTAVPAMLALIHPPWLLSRRRLERQTSPSTLAAWFTRWGTAVVRRRRWVIGLVLLVIALAPLGLRQLVIQDSWTDGFDPDSEFSRATRLVNDQFCGMHLLLVSFDAPQRLTGEIPASAFTVGRIILPNDLTVDPHSLLECTLSVFPAEESPGTDATNTVPRNAWRGHIITAARNGGGIIVHTPHEKASAVAWPSLSPTSRLRFEIIGSSHLNPDIIRDIDDLGAFIRARRQYGVGAVLNPADYLRTTRFMVRPDDPAARVLPASVDEATLLWNYYAVARGPQRLHQVVDRGYSRSLTTIFLKDANFVDTARLMSDIRAYERENLAPKGISLGFAGDVAVSQSLIAGIVTTQMQSLFWSLIGIYLVTVALWRSWRWGVYCVLPSTLAVVIKFAVMGWCGIHLGVATSMFAAMTLGIGVNCAIHLLEGFGRAQAKAASVTEALTRSLGLTGPPVLINTIAISLGFGILMLSPVPANARLGFLMVLGLMDCLVASLLILPVLLYWWPLNDMRETTLISGPEKLRGAQPPVNSPSRE